MFYGTVYGICCICVLAAKKSFGCDHTFVLPATIFADGLSAFRRKRSSRDVGKCHVTLSPTIVTAEGSFIISIAGKMGSALSVYLSEYLP